MADNTYIADYTVAFFTGFRFDMLITTNILAQLANKLSNKRLSIQPARHDYNLVHGISWWRLRKGNELPLQ